MLLTILIYLVLVILAVCALTAYLWYNKPSVIVKYGLRYGLYQSGMRLRSVHGKRYRYVYGEKGAACPDKTSLLLVHGFSASRDMWVPLVKRMASDLHVVVVDLPGHGGTDIPGPGDNVSAEEYADNVHEFAELIGLTSRPFHLVGTSLGGVVASLYALRHVDRVDRLTLICPAFETPVSTTFMDEVRRGECRLIPDTVNEMAYMLDSCFYNKKVIPTNKQILQGSLDLRLPRNHFFQRLFESLTSDLKTKAKRLEDEAKQITCPVQLIWGKHDELVHISGAEYLRGLLPNVQRVDLLDNCGHSVTFERPGASVKLLLAFRGELLGHKQD